MVSTIAYSVRFLNLLGVSLLLAATLAPTASADVSDECDPRHSYLAHNFCSSRPCTGPVDALCQQDGAKNEMHACNVYIDVDVSAVNCRQIQNENSFLFWDCDGAADIDCRDRSSGKRCLVSSSMVGCIFLR